MTAPPEQKTRPIVDEVFADNGEHSHWVLIDPQTGEKLWSEDPAECKAMGYPVKGTPNETSAPTEPLPPPKVEVKDIKDKIAVDLGYPNYDEWYNWISRSGEYPSVVAQQVEGFMERLVELYRFNRLDALERQLSGADKELPSEEVIMEWFPQRDDDGRFITKNIYHRGGARRFRSEASKTIAGLKSQLSDKEKEIERMKEALKMIEIETWRKAKMCCEVQSDFSVRSNGYDAICNHYNALLTPKQG